MQDQIKTSSRKKFILRSAVLIVTAGIAKFFIGSKSKKKYTVKMLTRDGRLVEVDRSALITPGKKISNEELKNWVDNKNSSSN
jgi:hypothetical protein